MRVEVYRNLHRKTFSVREVGGRVVRHADAVLIGSATFVVRPAGRARVLREGKKNVHAFVRGTDNGTPRAGLDALRLQEGHFNVVRVRYNPYRFGSFVNAETEEPVTRAATVWLVDGLIYASGVE